MINTPCLLIAALTAAYHHGPLVADTSSVGLCRAPASGCCRPLLSFLVRVVSLLPPLSPCLRCPPPISLSFAFLQGLDVLVFAILPELVSAFPSLSRPSLPFAVPLPLLARAPVSDLKLPVSSTGRTRETANPLPFRRRLDPSPSLYPLTAPPWTTRRLKLSWLLALQDQSASHLSRRRRCWQALAARCLRIHR